MQGDWHAQGVLQIFTLQGQGTTLEALPREQQQKSSNYAGRNLQTRKPPVLDRPETEIFELRSLFAIYSSLIYLDVAESLTHLGQLVLPSRVVLVHDWRWSKCYQQYTTLVLSDQLLVLHNNATSVFSSFRKWCHQ
jgi:hypothetical protein